MTGNRISMLRSEDFKQVVDLGLCAYGTTTLGKWTATSSFTSAIISCSLISARTRFTLYRAAMENSTNSQDPSEGVLKSNRHKSGPSSIEERSPLRLPG
ncbi:hypothetical protein CEXT_170941 [Caerostris extrusa]|uniref:Uncharacterized protein n=1 Tax=Caerostris extrusa TaxID=172846 RepID=A0AAV4XWK1_CAEEX|nr:hypothetical protein CEXT_170941 [Caerostris extrusa]